MIKYTLLLSLLLFSIVSYSQDSEVVKTETPTWILVGHDLEKTSYYIKSTMESKDFSNAYKVWVKELMPTFKIKTKIYKNVKILILYSFYCEEKQISKEQWVLYDSNGKVITNSQPYDTGIPENVIPDSMGESLLNKACELFNN